MKIVGEHLVRLPILDNYQQTKIYKVLETSGVNKQFYRENWINDEVVYELVCSELFYEQNSKSDLSQ